MVALPGVELPGMATGDSMLLLPPAAVRGARNPGEGSKCRELSIRPAVEGVPLSPPAPESSMSIHIGHLATGAKGREGRGPLQERAWAPRPLKVKGRPHLPQREKP